MRDEPRIKQHQIDTVKRQIEIATKNFYDAKRSMEIQSRRIKELNDTLAELQGGVVVEPVN